MKKFNKIIVASALSTSFLAMTAYATNPSTSYSVNVNASFITTISMSTTTAPSFGKLPAGLTAASTYAMTTAGVVTPTGTGAAVLSGPPVVGNVLIKGSATQAISISATAGTASGGVSVTDAQCAYGGGASSDCFTTPLLGAAPGTAGTSLLVAPTISVPAAQAVGAVTPALNIVVSYQ